MLAHHGREFANSRVLTDHAALDRQGKFTRTGQSAQQAPHEI